VSAELATDMVVKREKVENKPTEQRDVRDVESSEETGDYTSTEANPEENALRRAVHLRKVKARMKEQFVILKDFFFSDRFASLEETSGTVSDDDGMGPTMSCSLDSDHQTQTANRRFQKDNPDKRERDPSTDSNLSRPLKSSRTAVVKTTLHADELGGEYSEDDKQKAANTRMSAQPQHPLGSLDSTNNQTGTNRLYQCL
jgi:hypothetical protein